MKTFSSVQILARISIVMGMAAVGCSSFDELDSSGIVQEGEGDVATADQEIIRGTVISNATARTSGIVYVGAGNFGCTGTLLDANWVITAAHCVPAAFDANGDAEVDDAKLSQVFVRQGSPLDSGARQLGARRAVRHPNGVWETGGDVDVALLQLSSPADVSALPSNFFTGRRLALFPLPNASALSGLGDLYGYGANTARLVGEDFVDVTGSGTLRSSTLPITGTNLQLIQVSSATGTGVGAPGDSGGPTFIDVWQGTGVLRARYLAGVRSTSTGDAQPGYTTDTGAAAFRAWVENTAFGAAPATMNCNGTTCTTTLPNSISWLAAYAPRTANPNACYHVTATYNMEPNYDYVTFEGSRLTGSGAYNTHYCGTFPTYFTTDGSIQSPGVTFTASNFSNRPTIDGPSCAGTPGQWQGCRGTGCSVCSELTRDYPKYFVNHPSCEVNTTCAGLSYTCNSKCPAPTAADR